MSKQLRKNALHLSQGLQEERGTLEATQGLLERMSFLRLGHTELFSDHMILYRESCCPLYVENQAGGGGVYNKRDDLAHFRRSPCRSSRLDMGLSRDQIDVE